MFNRGGFAQSSVTEMQDVETKEEDVANSRGLRRPGG
jgi:hypothetical protein